MCPVSVPEFSTSTPYVGSATSRRALRLRPLTSGISISLLAFVAVSVVLLGLAGTSAEATFTSDAYRYVTKYISVPCEKRRCQTPPPAAHVFWQFDVDIGLSVLDHSQLRYGCRHLAPFYYNSAKLDDAQFGQVANELIDLPTHHFSFARNDTFKLRYLVNDSWWTENTGPIFFYTGNEGDIELFAQNTGFMWDIARQFGAKLVFAEHRYYGDSMPFGAQSYSDPQHLGYLTSQQAMADFIDVIAELRSNQTYAKKSPVIAFGGSYGGMLSAWIRMKYPHMVAGAISASAPVLMPLGITPCGAFLRIVTSDYQKASPNCAKNIRKSWSALRNITSTDAGKKWLSKEFKLHKALTTQEDVDELVDWLSDTYTNVAMANYPYPADFLGKMPAYPVNAVCEPLKQPIRDNKALALAIFQGINVYFNYTGNAHTLDLNNTDGMLSTTGWDFQACTEMVMPMCSDGVHDMFEPSAWDPVKYSNDCYNRWKVRPEMFIATKEYGGRDLSGTSNIIFSNGLQDPWACGGVIRNVSNTVLAVLIPEGAHHLDLRSKNPADPPSVRQARKLHRQNIKKWIHQHWQERQVDVENQLRSESEEELLYEQ